MPKHLVLDGGVLCGTREGYGRIEHPEWYDSTLPCPEGCLDGYARCEMPGCRAIAEVVDAERVELCLSCAAEAPEAEAA